MAESERHYISQWQTLTATDTTPAAARGGATVRVCGLRGPQFGPVPEPRSAQTRPLSRPVTQPAQIAGETRPPDVSGTTLIISELKSTERGMLFHHISACIHREIADFYYMMKEYETEMYYAGFFRVAALQVSIV